MTYKQRYRQFIRENPVPLFFQPFWLETFEGEWDVLYVTHEDQAAFFVYQIERKFSFRFIRNAFLTPYSGFIFCNKTASSIEKQKLIEKVLANFPAFDELCIDLHPEAGDYIESPLVDSHIRITNVLTLHPETDISNNYKPSLKRQIRKARQLVQISEQDDIGLFYRLYEKTFSKQQINAAIPLSAFEAVWQTCKKNGCGRLFFATEPEGVVHAALLLTYDEHTAYYLAGGTDASMYGSGAMSLLMHTAIESAAAMHKKYFDFEGSMLPNVNRFFKNFGPTEIRYLNLSKMTSGVLKLMRKISRR